MELRDLARSIFHKARGRKLDRSPCTISLGNRQEAREERMLSVWKFELMHTFDHELKRVWEWIDAACMHAVKRGERYQRHTHVCIWKLAIGLDGSLLACMHGRMAVKCKEQLVFRRTEEIGTLLWHAAKANLSKSVIRVLWILNLLTCTNSTRRDKREVSWNVRGVSSPWHSINTVFKIPI